MTQNIVLVAALLILSVIFNIYQTITLKKLKKKRVESYEVKNLLHDLLAGEGYIKVTRIAPTDFYLKRPQ